MSYMPFTSDDQPVYADEQENVLFRVKDFKKLIEEHTGLSVVDLMSMGNNNNPEKLRELYPILLPDCVWFVKATFQSVEGVKTSEVFIALKDGKLSLPHGIFLHVETFIASLRQKAKDQTSNLTLDYIQTLEETASNMWRLWRDMSYFLHGHRSETFTCEEIRQQFKQQMDELYRNMQSIGFLNTNEEKQDPFPTGW